VGAPVVADEKLEAATTITSKITQPFKGTGLRVIYLAKRVCYQLVGEDVP